MISVVPDDVTILSCYNPWLLSPKQEILGQFSTHAIGHFRFGL